MSDAKQATPHEQLIAELVRATEPKTEREHAAVREIERLQADMQDICVHHAEELRTVWDRNAELLTEIERLRAELAAAYAEFRKLSGRVRGIFDREVWNRAKLGE